MTGRILIVDDEKLTRETLALDLTDRGFEKVWTADNAYLALEILGRENVEVVLSDVMMPTMDGLEFQQVLHERWPDVPIILMTAFGSVSTAVEAMRMGAADYLTKPLSTDELVIRLQRLIERSRELTEIRQLRADVAHRRSIDALHYSSPAMEDVMRRTVSVADSDATVLIEGETGTGKELLANIVHSHSPRSKGPFVVVNGSGYNTNLIESELFGHEAGAFTGAHRQHRGRLEMAQGGTLFLDEVDDLPPEVQVRLLRFLQERTFERVGGNKPISADVRIVCATKSSLKELVEAGRFRRDLYYRMNTVIITLPPLRMRRQDIVPLALHFAAKFSAARGTSIEPEMTPEFLRLLIAYDWPGNVRELEHVIEHAVTFSRGAALQPQHLPETLGRAARSSFVDLNIPEGASVPYDDVVAECEWKLIEWALSRTAGNQTQAADLLQMSRTTFRSRHDALRSRRRIGNNEPPIAK